MSIKTQIVEHLIKKGSYDPDVDDYMIIELIENIQLSKQCLDQIKDEGVVSYYYTTKGDRLSKMNPIVGIYQMFQRNINQLSSKLGINRSDRLKLKLVEEQSTDEFDNDFK